MVRSWREGGKEVEGVKREGGVDFSSNKKKAT